MIPNSIARHLRLLALYCFDRTRTYDRQPLKSLSREGRRSISTLNSRILNFKRQNHVEVSVAVHISHRNMDRSGLHTGCTKTDGIRINAGRIKSIHAENCHIDILVAVRIYSIGIFLWPDVDGSQHRSTKLNRPDIADAGTEIS